MQSTDIWSVSTLNRAARDLLESGIGTVWLEAEVSNLARPASGHLYFSLKDAGAQLRAAFFRQRQRDSVRDLREGDQVLVRGRLSVYEPRGDYQLIVEHLEPAGEGALRRAFEHLRHKLAAEGLFDNAAKRSLPEFPRRIGVITSRTAAAFQDVLKVLGRRMPAVPVILYPALVQGKEAPASLRAALHRAATGQECDVLLIVRGGGSLEDLAAFNDEALARDVASCPLPVISGVGHETDVTIIDFVADERAPTPSAAAERAVPDGQALLELLRSSARRLERAQQRRLQRDAQRTDQLVRRLLLQNPATRVRRQSERLHSARVRLSRALLGRLRQDQQATLQLRHRLALREPGALVRQRQTLLTLLATRQERAIGALLERKANQLAAQARHLHAVSPIAVLGRGFSIVTNTKSGLVVADSADLASGDHVELRFADGTAEADITDVTPAVQESDDN